MRNAYDFYSTPAWCVHRLLESEIELPIGRWLEPCAGNGAIIQAVNDLEYQVEWWANDIQVDNYNAMKPLYHSMVIDTLYCTDFLHQYLIETHQCDVVFTNPPYSQAEAFIKKSMEYAPHVVMLLRLNFLGSEKRADFLREHTPDVYVLPNRPSFTGKGTDSTEYAWFHWHMNATGKLRILNSTPKSERNVS